MNSHHLTVDADEVSKEAQKKQAAKSKQMGVLKVEFFHMKNAELQDQTSSSMGDLRSQAGDKWSEKALKGKALDCKVA